jgi:HEAT repeat protein
MPKQLILACFLILLHSAPSHLRAEPSTTAEMVLQTKKDQVIASLRESFPAPKSKRFDKVLEEVQSLGLQREVTDLLVSFAKRHKSDLRKRALDALITLEVHSEKVQKLFEDVLEDDNDEIRANAAVHLLDSLPHRAKVLQTVRELLRRKRGGEKMACVVVMRLGSAAESVRPDLVAHLRDPDSWHHWSGLAALCALGTEDVSLLPSLIDGLSSEDRTVASLSDTLIRRMGKKAIPVLAAHLRTEKAGRTWRILDCLRQMGADAKLALPEIRMKLSDSREAVRSLAAEVVAELEKK